MGFRRAIRQRDPWGSATSFGLGKSRWVLARRLMGGSGR